MANGGTVLEPSTTKLSFYLTFLILPRTGSLKKS